MRRHYLLFIVLFSFSVALEAQQSTSVENEVAEPLAPQTQEELDRELLLSRLIEIYGQKRYIDRSVWEVSREGETQEWVWTGSQFEGCETTENFTCSNWIPISFQWFLSRNNWLEGWTTFSREEFYLGETKAKPRVISAHSVLGTFLMEELAREDPSQIAKLESEEINEVGGEDEDEEILIGGKRLAAEIWTWTRPGFSPFKIYSSLRNQWIERIDDGGSKEFLEWKEGPKRWSRPTLERVVLEKEGRRLTFKRSSKKAPKK